MASLTARELRAQKARRKPAREEQAERAAALGEADKAQHEAATALAEQAAQDAAAEVPDAILRTAQKLGAVLEDVRSLGLEAAMVKHGIGVDLAAPGADQTMIQRYDESALAEQDKYNTPQAKEQRRYAERQARIARGEEAP